MELVSEFLGGLGIVATKIGGKVVDDEIVPKISQKIKELTRKTPKHKAKSGMALLNRIKASDSYNSIINELYNKHLHIRTISKDSPYVYIEDIYIDLALDDKTGINNILSSERNTVHCIDGIAGQGKSTLMKKILLELIRKPMRLPFFIELRDLGDLTISGYISELLSRHNIESSKEAVESLFYSGHINLILDGFDELSTEKRVSTYKDIENISLKYGVPIVVSSRPDTEIISSYLVKNQKYKIKDLDEKTIIEMVQKLTDPLLYEAIKSILKKNKPLLESLITPILVSIFCYCYPKSDTVPNNAISYYDKIFDIVYEGHDKRKNFFKREKKYQASTSEVKRIFNAFSYISMMNKKTSFGKDFAIASLEKCLISTGKKDQLGLVDDILYDLVNVTSLIIEDGLYNYNYIHRTIQEYHAALFVKEATTVAKQSYQSTLTEKICSGDEYYCGTVSFLNEIDKANSTKSIFKSVMERIGINSIEMVNKNVNSIAEKISSELFMELIMHRREEKKKSNRESQVKETYMFGLIHNDNTRVALTPFIKDEFLSLKWFDGIIDKKINQTRLSWFIKNVEEKDGKKAKITHQKNGEIIKNVHYKPMPISKFLAETNLYEDVVNEFKENVIQILSIYESELGKANDEDIILI